MSELDEPWEYDVLGVTNPDSPGALAPYFDFLRQHPHLDGDVAEVGVFRGRSLIGTALLLRRLGSERTVVGFDSFAGFPTYSPEDDLDRFEMLYAEGRIDDDHLAKVRKNRELVEVAGRAATPAGASSSGAFDDTSRDLVTAKADYLGLDRIELREGDFETIMTPDRDADLRLCAALIDCDLYESYRISLPFVWDRLVAGGYLFLDEYYSLKFPGARIATDEFFAGRDEGPELIRVDTNGFERWCVHKAAT